MLPIDSKERKAIPVYSGFMCYFPDAIAEVAKLSKAGNDQHNPGEPLHWNRMKSGDELDALTRHLLDSTHDLPVETAILEARAVAWRAMANLQKLCETREEEGANEALHNEVLDQLRNDITQKSLDETGFKRTPQELEDYIAQLNTGFEGEKE